jgi:anti-sigma factor RsiW
VNCQEVVHLAPLYLSGEIDATRAAAMDAHLQTCPSCLHELEQQALQDSRLREAVHSEVADDATVIRRLRESIAECKGHQARRRILSGLRRRWVAVVGAAAMLLLLAGGSWLFRAPQIAEVCADAANDHRTEIVNKEPRPWLTVPAQIAALAERQGISGGAVVTLAPGNYHLDRARLCYLDRHVFLHLVYSDGAKEVSLFLRARSGSQQNPSGTEEEGTPVGRPDVNHAHLASFETARLTAVVVSGESPDAALQFAQSVSAAL